MDFYGFFQTLFMWQLSQVSYATYANVSRAFAKILLYIQSFNNELIIRLTCIWSVN